jgi:sulfofructose kinase
VGWLVVAEPFPTAYTGLTEPSKAAQTLLELGPELLVVTLGERGCAVWSRGPCAAKSFQTPGFSVDAVDTTGAGDAFHGAFLYATLQGWDLRRAVTFANAVAAVNCQTLGGRRGLPAREEADRFLARHS